MSNFGKKNLLCIALIFRMTIVLELFSFDTIFVRPTLYFPAKLRRQDDILGLRFVNVSFEVSQRKGLCFMFVLNAYETDCLKVISLYFLHEK